MSSLIPDGYYTREHVCCPKCHSAEVEAPMTNPVPLKRTGRVRYKDIHNRARCLACGWAGVVHYLVPRPATPEATP
jgi:hypothetical protein